MKLGGVIYLQSIEDKTSKMCRNLPMLRQLCGDNALARVVLGTTHWGKVDEHEGRVREQRLAKTFWMDSGSKSCRFDQTKRCSRAFLDVILGQLEFGRMEEIPEGRARPVVDSTIQNHNKKTSMNDHQVMILCVFSHLLIAIGTDSWC